MSSIFTSNGKRNARTMILKISLYLCFTYIGLLLNSLFAIIESSGDEMQVFFIFGAITFSLLFLFGAKYSLLTISLVSILLLFQNMEYEIFLEEILGFGFLILIYVIEIWALRKLNFNGSLKHINNLLFLITITFLVHFAIFLPLFIPSLSNWNDLQLAFSTIFFFWFRDVIGILTLFPLIYQISKYLKYKKFNIEVVKEDLNKFRGFITENYTIAIVIALFPIINQITVFFNEFLNLELFYIIYLPAIWLSTKCDIQIMSLIIPFINIGLFVNRQNISLSIIEFQFLVFTFTVVILLFSITIAENNLIIKDKNDLLIQSNKRLERLNRNLNTSNTELEQFAYIASHDLQEPLRAISGYLQLFDKKYGEYPDEKSKKYIDNVIIATGQMQQMISDLLSFSRIGTTNQEFKTVDLNDLMDDIIKMFNKQIKETNATITVEKLPTVTGIRSQLSNLFQNLISNSLKYSNDEPKIQISFEEIGNEYQISVIDNGIGIEDQYFNKIFVIFQRLHGQQEYEGTGIGLAIAKKIVERHGGEIKVTSIKGEGAKFDIILPKEAEI